MNMNSKLHRRNFIRGAGLALAGAPALLMGRAVSAPRTFALIGDRYHNADFIRVVLDRLFKSLNLPLDFTTDYEELTAKKLSGYQIFVCYRDGMIWPKGYLGPDAYPYAAGLENSALWPPEKPEPWISEQQGAAIQEFVRAGNGLYAFHNSSHISLYSQHFREVVGGAYIGHPALRPFQVRVVKRNHPITKDVGDFVVNDEQHYVIYDKEPANIILRSENLDGLRFENHGVETVAGWAYDYGKGRVVFTAAGHTLHALWQPEYLTIQKNAVRWLLRMA